MSRGTVEAKGVRHLTEGPGGEAATLLTADDLAIRWQVPKAHVYRLTREGFLPVVRLGRYCRYAEAAIAEFERRGGSSPAAHSGARNT